MSEFYNEMRGIANELLSGELGQSNTTDRQTIFYIRVTPGNGPADKPGAATETPFVINGVAKSVRRDFVDDTNIFVTDQMVVMAGRDDVTPDQKGFVTVNGDRYKVIRVIPTNGADVVIAWTLVIRK